MTLSQRLRLPGVSSASSDSLIRQPHQTASPDSLIRQPHWPMSSDTPTIHYNKICDPKGVILRLIQSSDMFLQIFQRIVVLV